MIWIGLAILIATVWGMVKRYEARLVLLLAGFAMVIVAGSPMQGFAGFTKGMTASNLILNICSVMGFAFVMKYTECDKHLGAGVAGVLRHVRPILLPAASFVTFFVNISLPSAAGVSAAVGTVVIPLLISQGIAPAMAASAVMMGTFGEMLSPGMPHNTIVAKIASVVYGRPVDVMEVISQHYVASICAELAAAGCLWLIAILLKETKGFVETDNEFGVPEGFKVNPFFAVIPIIPVSMLMLGAAFPAQLPWLSKLRVEHCMLIGMFIGIVATRKKPQECIKAFFTGMGKGYADIMGIIIAAGVFVAGLNAIGLVSAGIELMKTSETAAGIAAASGPFSLAVVCGSGNAAIIAFNEAITIYAPQFGMDVICMGSLATLSGVLGRAMSPLAGASIVCSGLAKVSPMEIAKRNAIPAIVGVIVSYIMLL